jgi:hypothetical protein
MDKDDPILKEYYELSSIVKEFDKNLLTVKGWGVTLALAALAWGFEKSHYGLFLVAAVSGLAFWLIEGAMKRHQMRYYFRMREIEVLCYDEWATGKKALSTPRIDSSWFHAGPFYTGKIKTPQYHPQMITGPVNSYRLAWLYPHVLLPHGVSVAAGIVLFIFARYCHWLGCMKW